jgi:hypothetical protein
MMMLLRSLPCLWILLGPVPLQDGSKEKQIRDLLDRKFDWNADEWPLTGYLSIIESNYCEGLQFFIDPIAAPEPDKLRFTVRATPGVTVGEALTRDLKTKGLRLAIWEGIVLITTEKGKEDFEKPDWSGLSAKALEDRRNLLEKLNVSWDFRVSPYDPKKALELLSKTSEVPIDASRIPEESSSKRRGQLLHPAKVSLRVALLCLSRATGITYEVTEKGLAAIPPKASDR